MAPTHARSSTSGEVEPPRSAGGAAARRRRATAPMRQDGRDQHDGVAVAHRAEDLAEVGARRPIGRDLEVVAVGLVPHVADPPREPQQRGGSRWRWRRRRRSVRAGGRPAAPAAAGTITGARSAFTETVAPMPSPIHIARRTVTSSRHRRTSAIVVGGEGQGGAVGGERAGDPEGGRGDAHQAGGEERAAPIGDRSAGDVGGDHEERARRRATAAAARWRCGARAGRRPRRAAGTADPGWRTRRGRAGRRLAWPPPRRRTRRRRRSGAPRPGRRAAGAPR